MVLLLLLPTLAAAVPGTLWNDRSDGISPRSLYSLSIGPGSWLAGGDGRVFRSVDHGRSWQVVLSIRKRGPRWTEDVERSPPVRAPTRGFGARARRAFRHLDADAERHSFDAARRVAVRLGGAERARFTAVAQTDRFACAGGPRGLWCTTGRGVFRRVPLHRGRAVHALLADPMRPGRILVGADEGVVTVGRGGERSRRAGLRRVRLLAAAGRRVFAASDAGLFLLESRGGARALALRPGQGRGRSIQALATHDPDLYLSGARKLWRLEGDLPVPVAGPAGGPSTALVVCGRRLAAANEGGAWRLGALGWRPLGIAAAVRSLGCIGERIVAATSLGLLVEFRGAGRPVRRRSQPRDLERASVPARLDSPGSLTRRARHAPWLPRLSLLARAVRSRDVHSPETVLLWPAPLSAPPRWNHEPVLRIRTSDRFEVLVLATWPLGAVGPEQTIRIARRVERRHQRLRLWLQRRIALLRQTIRDLPDDGAGTLLAGVQRRLRRAELEALLDGLTGASWERRS